MRFIRTVRKYVKIHCLFIKNCLISQMEYRFNFIMGIVLDGVFFLSTILYAVIAYRSGISINGLSPDEILLYGGTASLISGIYVAFFLVNFHYTLPDGIRDGTLDLYMTKPISLQFFVTTRYVEFPTIIPDIVGGIIVTVIAWNRLNIELSILRIIIYILFIICGVVMAYSIFFCFSLISFIVVKSSAINKISHSLLQFNNMPMSIYNKPVQRIGVFILPIFMVTNLPMLFIINKISLLYIFWGFISPFLFVFITGTLFKCAVKRYSSASS